MRRNDNKNNITIPIADMEPALRNALAGAETGQGLHSRCSIQIHSKRPRLTDPDGVSAKAAIDGLRASGVLIDDSAKYVKEVSYSQEIGVENETTLTIKFF